MIRKLLHYFNLEHEIISFDEIHESLTKDVVFKGTNLWILIFAILVASVGLNMNSTAVIIGAMLISPLMGPINGMGYSIATYDYSLLRKSVRNFTFAVITGLVTSTLYFLISPVNSAHSELLARTSPTIYDVLIAIFGGGAGMVAISSRQKGNVIPGVAIATALMPPLCTAGYGLAIWRMEYFLGAFYLFTINSVFIAFSALVISQILKFPIRALISSEQKRSINRIISTIIAFTIIPSIYFGYLLVANEKFTNNANRFINQVSFFQDNYLLRNEINPDRRTIRLVYGGSALSIEQKRQLIDSANKYNLQGVKLFVDQGLATTDLSKQETELGYLRAELNRVAQSVQFNIGDSVISSSQGAELAREIKALYPQISKVGIADAQVFQADSVTMGTHTPILVLTSTQAVAVTEQNRINNWVKAKYKIDDVLVIYRVE